MLTIITLITISLCVAEIYCQWNVSKGPVGNYFAYYSALFCFGIATITAAIVGYIINYFYGMIIGGIIIIAIRIISDKIICHIQY